MVRRRSAAALMLSACILSGCSQLAPETTSPSVPQIVVTEPSIPTEQTTVPQTTAPVETTEPAATNAVTEPPVPEADDFVRVLDYVPNSCQQLRYATTDNFTGQVIYEFTDAFLRYGTVCKLTVVARELEEMGLGIMIWDAYRPVYAQARLFEVYPDPQYVSKPGVGRQNHCRGLAIDLTVYDLETGEMLLMPSAFDDFSALADRDYWDVSEEAAEHASLLESVMERNGFTGYRGEWWHYNDNDDYPVEENFDPADFN